MSDRLTAVSVNRVASAAGTMLSSGAEATADSQLESPVSRGFGRLTGLLESLSGGERLTAEGYIKQTFGAERGKELGDQLGS